VNTDKNIGISSDFQLLLEWHVFIVYYLQKQIRVRECIIHPRPSHMTNIYTFDSERRLRRDLFMPNAEKVQTSKLHKTSNKAAEF